MGVRSASDRPGAGLLQVGQEKLRVTDLGRHAWGQGSNSCRLHIPGGGVARGGNCDTGEAPARPLELCTFVWRAKATLLSTCRGQAGAGRAWQCSQQHGVPLSLSGSGGLSLLAFVSTQIQRDKIFFCWTYCCAGVVARAAHPAAVVQGYSHTKEQLQEWCCLW